VSLFAALDLPNSTKVPGLVASDLILMIGLAALLFGGLITWIVFVRGPRKYPSENRELGKTTTSLSVTITEDGRERHRKKRRSRRREHRQRNPTLSQTGGLPPPRDPEENPIV